jgi:hypothetical protein
VSLLGFCRVIRFWLNDIRNHPASKLPFQEKAQGTIDDIQRDIPVTDRKIRILFSDIVLQSSGHENIQFFQGR